MTKAKKQSPYDEAADFGDMPEYEEYKWEEGDTSMFVGYKCVGLEPEKLDDPVERAAYAAWLKDNGHSID